MKNKHLLWILAIPLFTITGVVIGQTITERQIYSDVSPKSYYGGAVENLSLKGIIQGYDDGRFGPGDLVNRAQIAVMLDRYDQQVTDPIFHRIEAIRSHVGMGRCGDLTVQDGEECDDGNTANGDGCSQFCIYERLQSCSGGRSIGEWFDAPDGCNRCTCTVQGIACTESWCEEEIEEEIIEEAEEIIEESSSSVTTEVIPDTTSSPICGNGKCDQKENDLPPDRRFHCPQDCVGEPYQLECESMKDEFASMAEEYRTCNDQSDCKLFTQSCPFLTCGKPINTKGVPPLTMFAEEVINTCRKEGTVPSCALCPYSDSFCENGVCILKQIQR